MSPNEWQELLGRIEKNLYIEEFLYLGSLHLTDRDVYDLVGALAKNTSIKSLDLSQNGIGNPGAIALAGNETLRFLNLGGNENIDDDGAVALAGSTTLISLDLRLTGVRNFGVSALAKSQSLIYLNLEGNQIRDEAFCDLAESKTIRFLDLKDNKIRNAGAVALSKNPSLTVLNLRGNYIGNQGAMALALNKTLESLDLSKNEIGTEGFWALAKNETLRALKFDSKDYETQELVKERIRLNVKELALENRFEFMGFLWKRNYTTLDTQISPMIFKFADLFKPTEEELTEHQDNVEHAEDQYLSYASYTHY
jgi:Ran GTPase-activating protein (RanGAP) involved in mRNA processing and transport